MAWAEGVVAGRVVAGELVRLACERHLADLAHGAERGLWFDEAAARRALVIIGNMPQSKGEFGGRPLDLLPWQVFVISAIFGWKRDDGSRRFRTAWVEIGRKNGKTTLAAAIGTYLAFCDGEAGAEVYCVATKRDQAIICWREARYMVINGPKALRSRVEVFGGKTFAGGQLVDDGSSSIFKPLGSDEDSADGLNPHGNILDEVHRYRSRVFFGVINSAMGSRRQPLTLMITTAGDDPQSLGKEQHDYAEMVMRGTVDDDTYFAFIPTIDDPERWDDPQEWHKANPGLAYGVPRMEYLEDACRKARVIGSEKLTFLQMHCNTWVTVRADPWLPDGLYDEQAETTPDAELEGRRCFAGLDLASTTDIAAFALWWPDPGNPDAGDVRWWFWIPEEGLVARERASRGAPIRAWVDQGYIEVTPGRTIDYRVIEGRIAELQERFGFRTIAHDPWNAIETARNLQEQIGGLTMVQVPQTTTRLNAPTKEVERLLLERGFRHGGNPVARWMFANAVLARDRYQMVRVDREKSGDKVDGVAAAVLAVSEALAAGAEDSFMVVEV